MAEMRYIDTEDQARDAADWARRCAGAAGWTEAEAERLASCVCDSAASVARNAYQVDGPRPVMIRLVVEPDAAALELHHEGALGEGACDCAAIATADAQATQLWHDAQLRTFSMRIPR